MKKLLLGFAVLLFCASAYAGPGQPVNWYNSYGFEPGVDPTGMTPDFTPGPITGQGHWEAALPPGWIGTSAGGGVVPTVLPGDATGCGMGQIVEFVTGPVLADSSQMDIFFPTVKTGIVEIEWDMYRTELNVNNFWWWVPDAGDFTYGLEWDSSSAVHPFGWGPGAGQTPASLNAWDHIALEWDFGNAVVNSWVNGIPVDVNLPFGPNPPQGVSGFTFQFINDGGLPQGAVAYVDNFHVTRDVIPEPGVFVMLATGLGALLVCLKRKK